MSPPTAPGGGSGHSTGPSTIFSAPPVGSTSTTSSSVPHATGTHGTASTSSATIGVSTSSFVPLPPVSSRTPELMPLLGQKSAPAKFHGRYDEVKYFLRHYNQLCKGYNVSDVEKCERIIDYCSSRVVQLIEALPSYISKNWTKLQADILAYFDADLKETRFIRRDLLSLTRQWKHKNINSLTTWKRYERKFITIAGWLYAKGKITDDQQSAYFWNGINKRLRSKIEAKLSNASGSIPLDVTTAFPMSEVKKIAEVLFERNRFDLELADSDSEIPIQENDTDSDSDSSSDDTSDESDTDRKYRKKQKTKKKTKKSVNEKRSHKVKWDSDDEDIKDTIKKSSKKVLEEKDSKQRKPAKVVDEVESLIRKMKKLSIDDDEYGITFYKAFKLDPDIVHFIKPPNLTPPPKPSTSRSNNPYPTSNTFPMNGPISCYGCGTKGHGMSSCPQISELVASGTITYDDNRKIVLRDGSLIRRFTNETFVQAIKRLTGNGPKSNFIALQQSCSDYSESEEEDNDVFVIPVSDDDDYEIRSDEVRVMEAERYPHKIKTARKEALEGVYPPSRKGKENVKPPQVIPPIPTHPVRPGPLKAQTRSQGQPFTTPINSRPRAQPLNRETEFRKAQPIPVDVRTKRNIQVDFDNDVEMKDGQKKYPRKQSDPKNADDKDAYSRPKPQLRQSEISASISNNQVVHNILETPITLKVKEVLGSSREVSERFSEMIKRKNIKEPTVANLGESIVASTQARTQEFLIELPMECDNRSFSAIIDTGSQLNVLSKSAWRRFIKRPMDVSKAMTMRDANGGEGVLRGLVSSVPLTCGRVQTTANFYVGDSAPFDVLLGRPWQRGNRVTIDERHDGTYLLFKDGKGINNKFEIFVSSEQISYDHGSSNMFYDNPYSSPLISACGLLTQGQPEVQHDISQDNSDLTAKFELRPNFESHVTKSRESSKSGNGIFSDIFPISKIPPPSNKSLSEENLIDNDTSIPESDNNELKIYKATERNSQNLHFEPPTRNPVMTQPSVTPGLPSPFSANELPLPSTVDWGPPLSRVPSGPVDAIIRGINERVAHPDAPTDLFIFTSPFGYRFSPQLDNQGMPFEHGIVLNATLATLPIATPDAPPSVRLGQLYFMFYPTSAEINEAVATPPASDDDSEFIRSAPVNNRRTPVDHPAPPYDRNWAEPNAGLGMRINDMSTTHTDTKHLISEDERPTLDPRISFARPHITPPPHSPRIITTDPRTHGPSAESLAESFRLEQKYAKRQTAEAHQLNSQHTHPRIVEHTSPQGDMFGTRVQDDMIGMPQRLVSITTVDRNDSDITVIEAPEHLRVSLRLPDITLPSCPPIPSINHDQPTSSLEDGSVPVEDRHIPFYPSNLQEVTHPAMNATLPDNVASTGESVPPRLHTPMDIPNHFHPTWTPVSSFLVTQTSGLTTSVPHVSQVQQPFEYPQLPPFASNPAMSTAYSENTGIGTQHHNKLLALANLESEAHDAPFIPHLGMDNGPVIPPPTPARILAQRQAAQEFTDHVSRQALGDRSNLQSPLPSNPRYNTFIIPPDSSMLFNGSQYHSGVPTNINDGQTPDLSYPSDSLAPVLPRPRTPLFLPATPTPTPSLSSTPEREISESIGSTDSYSPYSPQPVYMDSPRYHPYSPRPFTRSPSPIEYDTYREYNHYQHLTSSSAIDSLLPPSPSMTDLSSLDSDPLVRRDHYGHYYNGTGAHWDIVTDTDSNVSTPPSLSTFSEGANTISVSAYSSPISDSQPKESKNIAQGMSAPHAAQPSGSIPFPQNLVGNTSEPIYISDSDSDESMYYDPDSDDEMDVFNHPPPQPYTPSYPSLANHPPPMATHTPVSELLAQLRTEEPLPQPMEGVQVYSFVTSQPSSSSAPRDTFISPYTDPDSRKNHLFFLCGIRASYQAGINRVVKILSMPLWKSYIQGLPDHNPSHHYFLYHCYIFPFWKADQPCHGKEFTPCPLTFHPTSHFGEERNSLLTEAEAEFLHHASLIFFSRNKSLLSDAINAVLSMRFRHASVITTLFENGYLDPSYLGPDSHIFEEDA
jgi:hypothetical protein